MKRRKLTALCAAVLCVGGYTLAQDRGFDTPINSGIHVPIPSAGTGDEGFYSGYGVFGEAQLPPAPKSRAEGMTAEQIAGALDAVRVQKDALEQWERELRSAALSKRVASWGVTAERRPKPAQQQVFTFIVGIFN